MGWNDVVHVLSDEVCEKPGVPDYPHVGEAANRALHRVMTGLRDLTLYVSYVW